jgi:hypothetical protein
MPTSRMRCRIGVQKLFACKRVEGDPGLRHRMSTHRSPGHGGPGMTAGRTWKIPAEFFRSSLIPYRSRAPCPRTTALRSQAD